MHRWEAEEPHRRWVRRRYRDRDGSVPGASPAEGIDDDSVLVEIDGRDFRLLRELRGGHRH